MFWFANRPSSSGRVIAALIALVILVAAVPTTALADDDEGLWSQWASEVTDRESPAEVPLAILATLPAMILITPFWLGQLAIEKMSDDEGDA